jgi:hypothetical protein
MPVPLAAGGPMEGIIAMSARLPPAARYFITHRSRKTLRQPRRRPAGGGWGRRWSGPAAAAATAGISTIDQAQLRQGMAIGYNVKRERLAAGPAGATHRRQPRAVRPAR